jgi:predicted ATPase/DNA-binding SARP family transcriptional activator
VTRDRSPSLRVGVLGPLSLVVDGMSVEVPGPRQRAVLALLALAEGRTVTVDDLLDALWTTTARESGRRSLHSTVSRLRGQLGPASGRLVTRPDGYRLQLTADELDLARARALLRSARTVVETAPRDAFATLSEAKALWRGPVLADLDHVVSLATAIEGLAQLQRAVTDALIDSAVRAGAADEVLGLAADAVAADPLREPAVLLQMRALAATGQASAALHVARDFRRRLADEAGLDSSPGLDELQRAIAAGSAAHPPARPASSLPTNLSLIGRETEVAAVRQLLAAERLVTIVGPGGIGKTSLALEVVRRSDAVTWLVLASVTDPASAAHALAAALDLQVTQGDVLAACVAVLRDRRAVLVLDNCEHLLDTIRDMIDVVLSSCPAVAVLATSREALGLPVEHVVRLAPLALPVPGQDPRRVASVAVFLDRATRVRPGFEPTPQELEAVADLVRRLDGLPLAIELAAGRLSTFSVSDLVDRLDRSLDLLGDARPRQDARHRTLRATLTWSYELLTGDERRLFRHLAVFPDGVPIEAAERIAADLQVAVDPGNVLARLVDASMIVAEFDEGRTRYRMLEVLRAFGRDRLVAAGEVDQAERGMLRWAVELADWLEGSLATDREPEADGVLRRELPNLRAAWGLARRRGDLDAAVAMVVQLFDAIAYRDLVELRGWAAQVAADPAIVEHPQAAAVLGTAAEAAYHRGDHEEADRLARRGLELTTDEAAAWYCLLPRSVVALARGALPEAVADALRAVGSGHHRDAHGIAALATAYAGDLEEARRCNELGVAAAVSPSMQAWAAYVDGEIESLGDHRELAEQHYLRAIELARRSGASFLEGIAAVGLVAVRGRGPRAREALSGYQQTIDYFARTGNWTHLWATLRNLADLLRRLGDDEPAALLEAAAAEAPDAPALAHAGSGGAPHQAGMAPATPGRAEVLELARRSIVRNLG